MALFGDDDEENDTNESSGWGVDENTAGSGGVDDATDAAAADPALNDQSDSDLTELDTATLSRGDPNGTLKRAVDREAGVVVYAYKNGNAGGLSTVPLSETDLGPDSE